MMRKTLIFAAAIVLATTAGMASTDEYNRIARVSRLDGHVSFQHTDEVDWTAASINMALQPGDRLYTGEDGRAEIQIDDGSVLHLAERTDLELLSLNDDFVQIRILTGLLTLTLRSSIDYEISTPAAAFDTLRKGVYRFDVVENGDTDAVVRKGLLEAANDTFSRQLEPGELIHVTPGDQSTNVVSRYGQKDTWDEWTDRADADFLAYESRKYLPDTVYVGASDLDAYGRWVVVDSYGPAWVPNYMDADWSPYSVGRWWYRPAWGWTWVSYEPWGWLPYHYGRWYHHRSFGWCWLPGVSFGFHFWSPGLVRFYQGPSWVSWCPLGPGDYYNVNNYRYSRSYSYYLNNLRLMQRRGPAELVNRDAPGAFRTVQTTSFVNTSVGRVGSNPTSVSVVAQPWREGRMVTDRLGIEPTSRSFAPAPERPVIRPLTSRSLPSVVRIEPSVVPSSGRSSVVRISPGSRGAGGGGSGPVSTGRGAPAVNSGSDFGRSGGVIDRSGSTGRNPAPARPGIEVGTPSTRTPPPSATAPAPRSSARDNAGEASSVRQESQRKDPANPPTIKPPSSRTDKPGPAPERPKPQENPRPDGVSRSGNYSSPVARSVPSGPQGGNRSERGQSPASSFSSAGGRGSSAQGGASKSTPQGSRSAPAQNNRRH